MSAANVYLPELHSGQLAVLAGRRRFNWLVAGRRWRKTTLFMGLAVETALNGEPCVWGAPTFDQVSIGWNEMKRACSQVATFNQGRMTADFITGGRVIFRSLDNPDNARGHTAKRVIIDEVADVRPWAWHEVLRPMLSDTRGDAYLGGTPKGMDWVWEQWERAHHDRNSAAWQAPVLGARVENGELVRVPHPLENPHLQFDELLGIFASTPERSFRQEYLAEFVDAGDSVFNMADVDAMSLGWHGLKPRADGSRYATAWDIGRRRDATWGFTVDWTTEPYQIVASERVFGVPYPEIQRLIAEHHRHYGGYLRVESNGVGDPVIENLDVVADPFVTTSRSKVDAISALKLLLEKRALKGDIPLLARELKAYKWDDRDITQDGVMALAMLAHWLPQPGTVDRLPESKAMGKPIYEAMRPFASSLPGEW